MLLRNLSEERVFWVVPLCSLETARCFRGTHQLHFLGKRVCQIRNQMKQLTMQAQARVCVNLLAV
jgi:hypothetical protein